MAEGNVSKSAAIEEGRASFAFREVKDFVDSHRGKKDANKNFKSYIKKMPTMIQVNGLGQTIAFYYSKGEVYTQIYSIIEKSLRQRFDNFSADLIEWIVNLDSKQYRIATEETMALLNWMRKFVSGMVEDSDQ